jgi:hypothetical protein
MCNDINNFYIMQRNYGEWKWMIIILEMKNGFRKLWFMQNI